jgi:hypothetical protein
MTVATTMLARQGQVLFDEISGFRGQGAGDGASLPRSFANPGNMTDMSSNRSTIADWSPAEVARARRWVRTWRDAGPRLEAIRRRELRELDAFTAISWLCGPASYDEPPRAPKPTSGLIEQQRLFRMLRRP